MENNIVEYFNNYKSIATLLFGIVTAIFIIFNKWINFLEYFKYKKINHFSKLLDQVKSNSELQKTVENANNEAIFQSLTGYSASRKMIEATCKLFNSGNLSLSKIKLCYRFFKLNNQETLEIKFSKEDKLLAALSALMVLVGTIYFLLLAFVTLYKVELNIFQGFILGVTILVIYLLYVFAIGRDFLYYSTAKRVKKELNL